MALLETTRTARKTKLNRKEVTLILQKPSQMTIFRPLPLQEKTELTQKSRLDHQPRMSMRHTAPMASQKKFTHLNPECT